MHHRLATSGYLLCASVSLYFKKRGVTVRFNSMPFLAFPSPTVLVKRVARFDLFQASWADKDPTLRFINANSIQDVVRFFAAITSLGTNAFDRHLRRTFDSGSGTDRLGILARKHAWFYGPWSSLAKVGTTMA
jgi:hypothetical protein